MYRRPPEAPPFPYTTLFRSRLPGLGGDDSDRVALLVVHQRRRSPSPAPSAHMIEQKDPSGGPAGQMPPDPPARPAVERHVEDRKSTRLNSSHSSISYAVFCL